MRDRVPRGAAADDAVVLGAFLALGVVCAVLWWWVVDPAVYVKGPDGAQMSEVELMRRFDADGWYSVIAGVVGFIAGLVLTWWRSRDYRLTTLLVVLGSVGAAATMAIVGRALGPGDPERAIDAAGVGARVPVQLLVTVDAAYLVWPVAVLLGALMVLWSSPRVGARELAEDLPPDAAGRSVPGQWDERFPERTPG